MRKLLVPILLVSTGLLSACTSYKGTTYGSGTTHEEQTFKGLYNMLSLQAEQPDPIDYRARPDLVMPSSKATLPQPEQDTTNTENNWPVAPEEKLATIRESAPQPDLRTGDLPTDYLVGQKDGISSSAGSGKSTTRRSSAKALGSGQELVEAVRADSQENNASNVVRQRREQLAYSTGVKRKFLIEPPAEYRQPSENAEAGDLGISKEEVDERQRRLEKEKWNTDRGVLTPGS